MADTFTVKINNWEKYNPRKDIKRPHWLALSNRVLEDPSLFELSAEELKAFLYILCQASQQSSDEPKIFPEHAKYVCKISASSMASCVSKLQLSGVFGEQNPYGSVRIRTGDQSACTGPYIAQQSHEHDTTLHNTTHTHDRSIVVSDINVKSKREVSEDDLLKVYAKYPRKQGKASGLKKALKTIYTTNDLDKLNLAVARYQEHSVKMGVEKQFIMHFSTFMNCWKDWLDDDAGNISLPTNNIRRIGVPE